MRHLLAIDEAEPGRSHDAIALERGLERDIEGRQRIYGGEARLLQRRVDPATFAMVDAVFPVPTRSHLHILLVEDDADLSEALCDALTDSGHTFELACRSKR